VTLASLYLLARPRFVTSFLHWLHHLGGPGLILLGLLDNSVLPIPGSMDVATVVFCAQNKRWWPYYVAMATAGGVLGGYITYRLARGEGKKSRLGNRLSRSQMKRVKEIFEKWGFGSIVIPALLPPPMPMVPFLLAAGATQYSRNKFLLALLVGRAVRYSILGLLGVLYGRWIITLMQQHQRTIIWVGAAMIAASVAVAAFRLRREAAPAH